MRCHSERSETAAGRLSYDGKSGPHSELDPSLRSE
jgi:hypothetical protein